MKLKIQARAKINWTLDVVGTLPNGYHDLDMLMQSVTLCDQMTMEEAPQLTLYVRAQGRSFVPADGNNLVLKAAAALQAATGCTRGARITLKKYIPVAAGMGGGSSDAAAALVGLNRLWGLGLSPDKLEEIGLTVGADVPFCIRGGLQRAKGVGEKLTPLAMKKPLYLVAFQPCRGLIDQRGVHRPARGRHPRARTGRITRRRSVRWPAAMFARSARRWGMCLNRFQGACAPKLTAPFAPLRKTARCCGGANDGQRAQRFSACSCTRAHVAGRRIGS